MTHLDSATLRAYRDKRLSPATLLAADDHLGECTECREAMLDDGAGAADSIIDALTADDSDEHLTYDTLEAWVDGTLSPREHREASAHLRTCSHCANDLGDLRSAAATMLPGAPASRRATALRIAAAVLLAVIGASVWIATSHRAAPTAHAAAAAAAPVRIASLHDAAGEIALTADGRIHGIDVSPADAALVRDALLQQQVATNPQAAALRGDGGTLMGSVTAASTFSVQAPVATFVADTRPRFDWIPLADGTTYTVEVYDAGGRRVLQSAPLHETTWTATADLARGGEYTWQVVGQRGGERVIAPRPPSPEARFGVLDASADARIRTAQSTRSHLVLALVCAREGATDAAKSQLDLLAHLNPGSPLVERLRQRLDTR